MADAGDLKSPAARRTGSSPVSGTTSKIESARETTPVGMSSTRVGFDPTPVGLEPTGVRQGLGCGAEGIAIAGFLLSSRLSGIPSAGRHQLALELV
jgi:hypothetical protein